MSREEEKAALRAICAARRAEAHAAAPAGAGVAALGTLLARQKGRVMSGYLPIRDEIDPRGAMALAVRHSAVGVPVIEAARRPLRFREWTPDAALVPGPFGVMIPQAGEWLVPEVLVLPLLAFDAQGNRLGYGGGYYDRTLAVLRRAGPVIAIGFAYAAQQVDRVPAEPTDQPLDMIVTEAGVLVAGAA
ncbi:5-formyltetrahydrofolate cyclo-ligase [Profundibacterium mesophilum]|uniref:5-formyltetrahydrofolate cyclo-ligase n=1 Tax=Profundibacterium mesophilum KAUST100406-0324 TaxID=1037889 RepID=A0A921TC91_9RHOB|nr:5-formyltetrahydrofolate cyclo-ligase [Profundibacterium mesophilum]KAF0675403.1 5-formyltetrahydrofolate cyclo-ligase [Profundibacterium mesophilum KAUST100406-0324]